MLKGDFFVTLFILVLNYKEFLDESGEPKPLPIEGSKASFSSLITKHSGSMTVRAMLDEMIRVKAVRLDASGRAELINTVYVPEESDPQRLHYMGEASADLLSTISINLEDPTANRLQLTTAFDNLPEECIPEFKRYDRTYSF